MKLTEAQRYNLDAFRAFGGMLHYGSSFQWFIPGEAKPLIGLGLNWIAIRSLIKMKLIEKIPEHCTDKVDAYALVKSPTTREISDARRNLGLGARA